MKQIANDIDQSIRRNENRQKILHIQNSFVRTGSNNIQVFFIYISCNFLHQSCLNHIVYISKMVH